MQLNNDKELVYCKYFGEDNIKKSAKIAMQKGEETPIISEEASLLALLGELRKIEPSASKISSFLKTKGIELSASQIEAMLEVVVEKIEKQIPSKQDLFSVKQ